LDLTILNPSSGITTSSSATDGDVSSTGLQNANGGGVVGATEGGGSPTVGATSTSTSTSTSSSTTSSSSAIDATTAVSTATELSSPANAVDEKTGIKTISAAASYHQTPEWYLLFVVNALALVVSVAYLL